ncbi:MAG: PHP domain-containing protein, partial [Alphaproteobacteria bacterium]|nr:PHP domain-containing protein [Alphaproteobacteria bacterium]
MPDDSSASSTTFIHLRTHTAYSLSEGALKIKALANLAYEARMPALAITDTGNLFGALEFSDMLAEKGIQPIIGCTLKVDIAETPKDGNFRPQHGLRRIPSLAFLARDAEGYGNLMKLSSRAYLSSPDNAEHHVTWDYLSDHAAGLICLTGGPLGPVNDALVAGQMPLARAQIEKLKGLLGDRLYIELQRHGTEAERIAEAGLIEIAYDLDVPLVATNEAYFARADDYVAHDALICIADGEAIATEDRRRLTPEHYFKSQAEMAALFADVPEAIENTVEIAMRCAYRVKSRNPILPRFAEGDEAEELRRQAHDGLSQRLATRGPVDGRSLDDYRKRLDFELDVITKMQFPGYFLIVADFI